MGLTCESVTEEFVVICQRVLFSRPFSLPPRLDFYEWWLLARVGQNACTVHGRTFLKDLQFLFRNSKLREDAIQAQQSRVAASHISRLQKTSFPALLMPPSPYPQQRRHPQ